MINFIEYNPKLSDVTKTTRVAFVKFMASSTLKPPARDDVSIVDETKMSLSRTSSKSITDFAINLQKATVSISICYGNVIYFLL